MPDDSFKDHVLDQLSDIERLSSRAMFGGHGLYCGREFFAIVYQGRLYLRTNEANAAEFVHRGMKPFRPNDRQTMKYHEVPPEIFEDRAMLLEWTRCSIAIANKSHEE